MSVFEITAHTHESPQNGYALFKGDKGQKPDHILVFRDGVSEGEYKQVEENEVKPLEGQLLSVIFFFISSDFGHRGHR